MYMHFETITDNPLRLKKHFLLFTTDVHEVQNYLSLDFSWDASHAHITYYYSVQELTNPSALFRVKLLMNFQTVDNLSS